MLWLKYAVKTPNSEKTMDMSTKAASTSTYVHLIPLIYMYFQYQFHSATIIRPDSRVNYMLYNLHL